MGIQEKKVLPIIPQQSISLAKQALWEKQEQGFVSVVCPKCHQHPEVTTTPRGERTTVLCKCGFVKGGEIYL